MGIMNDSAVILEIAKILSGSPSIWLSILLAGFVLKRCVINGSLNRFLNLKEQEVNSLKSLEKSLEAVICEQKKLYDKIPGG